MLNKILEIIKKNYLALSFAIALIVILGGAYFVFDNTDFLWAVAGLSLYTSVFFGAHLRDAFTETKEPWWVTQTKLKTEDQKIMLLLKSKIGHTTESIWMSLFAFTLFYVSDVTITWLYYAGIIMSSLWFVISAFLTASFRIIRRDWIKYQKHQRDDAGAFSDAVLEDVRQKSNLLDQELKRRSDNWTEVDVGNLDK